MAFWFALLIGGIAGWWLFAQLARRSINRNGPNLIAAGLAALFVAIVVYSLTSRFF